MKVFKGPAKVLGVGVVSGANPAARSSSGGAHAPGSPQEAGFSCLPPPASAPDDQLSYPLSALKYRIIKKGAVVVSLPAGAAILPASRRPDCARRKQPFRILGLALQLLLLEMSESMGNHDSEV